MQRLLRRHTVNSARLVMERDAVALVRHMHNLRAERRADELRLLLARDAHQQAGHRRPVLRVQVGVDLVKDDERARLGRLERENQAEGA
jgi:hypothetical protein